MQLQFTTEIAGSPEAVFETIADLEGYHRWLGRSASFASTTKVTPVPVCLGTTYVDAGLAGTRQGTVTEFDPPKHLGFHQPMKAPLAGTIEINVRYTLERDGESTRVIRDLVLAFEIPGPVKLLIPAILPMFKSENARILASLKRHLETKVPA